MVTIDEFCMTVPSTLQVMSKSGIPYPTQTNKAVSPTNRDVSFDIMTSSNSSATMRRFMYTLS